MCDDLIPGLEDVFRAAKGAGAHGVAKGIKAKIMVLDADNEGVKVEISKAQTNSIYKYFYLIIVLILILTGCGRACIKQWQN